MPLSLFRRRSKASTHQSNKEAPDADLPLALATAPGDKDALQLADDDNPPGIYDYLTGEESHAAKAQRLQQELSRHSAHYASDAAKEAKKVRQQRYQRLAQADMVLQNPAISVTMAALGQFPGVRHAMKFLNVAVKIKNTGQEVYLKFNTVFSKVVALIQLMEDLVDRYAGRAAEALSDTHLNTFWDKMDQSSVLFEKVTKEMGKFDDTKAWKQFINGNVWKRMVDDLDTLVDDLLADVHAHASLSGVAQQRRQLTQSTQMTDALAHHAKAIEKHDEFMSVVVHELQTQAATRHQQHLDMIAQIRTALAQQNLTMGYFNTMKNAEIVGLWAHAFGKGAQPFQPASGLRTVLMDYLAKEYPKMTPDMPEHAAARLLAQGDRVAIEDLVGIHRGRNISAKKLDLAFPAESGVALPQVIAWKVYGWTALAQVQSQSLRALAGNKGTPHGDAAKRADIAFKNVLKAWGVDTPTLRYVLTQLRPVLGQRLSNQLPPAAQALVDAYMALTALVDGVLTGPATDVEWISDPESPAYSTYVVQFPHLLAEWVNALVDACERLGGLDASLATKLRLKPAAVAKHEKDARARAAAQLEALDHVLQATSEDRINAPLDALVADWLEFEPQVDPACRAQHVTRKGGVAGTLIQLTQVEAERIVPRIVQQLPALASNPYVVHLLAIVPPMPDAEFPHWGLFFDADPEHVPLELADNDDAPRGVQLDTLSPAARATLVKHVVQGMLAVHAANERLAEALPVYPLALSPATVVVGANAMGNVVARVVPCAGVFFVGATIDWNRQEYEDFVAPELRTNASAWTEGVTAQVAARADWWAVGQLVASLFPEFDEPGKRCDVLDDLVAKLCQENPDDRAPTDVEQVVCQVVAIGAEAEKCNKRPASKTAAKPAPVVAKPPPVPETVAAQPAPMRPSSTATVSPSSHLPTRPPALPNPPPCVSLDAAETAFFAARNVIRQATGPVTVPDYDVGDTLHKLLSAGSHIGLALVLAADMYYYGAVPRTGDSWAIAKYLYTKAAIDLNCDYANVGLGDLCLFQLDADATTMGDNNAQVRVSKALAYYERALRFVDNPARTLELTPADRARVYTGLADAYFAQAELSPARAMELQVRAKSHYQMAYERDPKSKRVLAKRALFKIKGLGGELVDRELGLKDLRSARSRDNPVHELRARLVVYEMDGDERGAAAARRMIDGAEVPAH